MMPSSAGSGPGRGSNLRRWGPIALVAAVALIAGAVLVFAGGGDDGNGAATTDTGTGTGTDDGSDINDAGTGAISFSQAQEEGLDVEFSDTCDEETGRIALPFWFAAECYAEVADNGGATAPGVTADTITVVAYIPPAVDPILQVVLAAIASDDTPEQVEATYAGYTELFQSYYQTYGRKVELKFLRGSGFITDQVAARADAVKAVEELGAFAVWGGPALADSWTEEIKARGVICLLCPGITSNEPSVFTVTASTTQTRTHLAEWLEKRLAGEPASHAGDPALTSQTRVFGQLYIDTGGDEPEQAADFRELLAGRGIELAEQIGYALDPTRLQEQATAAIGQMKSAGVTTVIFTGDPLAPGTFTREATAQEYFPEWVLGGSALLDFTAFGRTYDQQQWAHAFGISSLAARTLPQASDSWFLYEWFHGSPPPADDTAGVLYPQPSLFFAAVQAAGPDLTLDTFREGLFAFEPQRGALTSPTVSFGEHGIWDSVDYNGIDDFTELWWDADETGPDEIRKEGAGMYRYSDGGKRYFPGEWTSELHAFEEEGSVAIYEERPASERPPPYPSPAD